MKLQEQAMRLPRAGQRRKSTGVATSQVQNLSVEPAGPRSGNSAFGIWASPSADAGSNCPGTRLARFARDVQRDRREPGRVD